ncbi:hypothetical protein CPCC7001_393 [Cyanobium sp. PCC 7001]|nr:hypothetical protein CPCC7001_393 [Cyanobium sp. PCC 7001]
MTWTDLVETLSSAARPSAVSCGPVSQSGSAQQGPDHGSRSVPSAPAASHAA